MLTYWRRFRPVLRVGIKILGPLLLLYFLATADLRFLVQSLSRADPELVLAATLLAIPFFVLKALRWQLVLAIWQVKIPLRLAVPFVCIGQYAGTVTPGQTGDAIRGWYLAQHGYPLEIGVGSVALDRIFDLLITLGVAAVALLFFQSELIQLPVYIRGSILLLLLLAPLLFLASRNARARSAAAQHVQKLPNVIRERLVNSPLLHIQLAPRHACLIMMVSIAALSWTYIRIYLLVLALGISLPIWSFITFVAVLSLVGPSSPGGVGTRDALLVVVLQTTTGLQHDVALAQALALSALILLLNVVNVTIGFGFSLRYRLDGRVPNTQLRS